MTLTREDLTAISHLGQALWVQEEESRTAALEALAGVSLMQLSPERALEKASEALLIRALRDGPRAASAGLQQPFYRLSAQERLILSALHGGKWSYARIGQILGRAAEDVERLAWRSRVEVGAMVAAYPSGAKAQSPQCPEYDSGRPWTQRFLDEELTPSEHLFLTNHLVACIPCRDTLMRCRTMYYAVDAVVPRTDARSDRVALFERALKEMHYFQRPMERPFVESILNFVLRPDVAWPLLAMLGVTILGFWLGK